MAACIGGNRRRWQVIVAAIVTPFLVVLGLCAESIGSEPMTGIFAASAMGMSQPRLVYLKPGLRITKKPPEGWTHLVVKSIPRLASGDRGARSRAPGKTANLVPECVCLQMLNRSTSMRKDFRVNADRGRSNT